MGRPTKPKSKRNARIFEKAKAGKPTWEIAADHHITTQRVLQIVAAERRRLLRETTAKPVSAEST